MKLPHTEVKFYPKVKFQTGLSSLPVSCKRAQSLSRPLLFTCISGGVQANESVCADHFSQVAVRSRGEWSRLQQGDDSQIFFSYLISLIFFLNLTKESSDSINEGKNDLQVLLEK